MGKNIFSVTKEVKCFLKHQRNLSVKASVKCNTTTCRSRSIPRFVVDTKHRFIHCCRGLSSVPGLFKLYVSGENAAYSITKRLLATYVKKKSHYEILDVSRNASSEEIRQAFISLSKTWHPDTDTNDPTRHQKFVKINEAYSVLSKPLSRRDYDLSLNAEKYVSRQMSAAASRTYGYGGYSQHAGPYYHHRGHVYDESYWTGETHTASNSRLTSLLNFYLLIGCATLATVSIIMHYVYNYIPNPKHHHLRKNISPEDVEKHDFIMQSEQDGVTVYYYAVPKKGSKKFDVVVLKKAQEFNTEEPKMHEVTRSPK